MIPLGNNNIITMAGSSSVCDESSIFYSAQNSNTSVTGKLIGISMAEPPGAQSDYVTPFPQVHQSADLSIAFK